MAALPQVRREIARLDPNLALASVMSLSQATSVSVLPARAAAAVLAALGGMVLVLGAIGTYGVMSCVVSQRAREIGIRMALGAESRAVVWLVLRQALVLCGIGVVIGLGAALAVGRLIAGLLYGLSPTDPAALGLASALIAVVALAAGCLPAVRAARLDPMKALRCE